jgi:hypothetical protein
MSEEKLESSKSESFERLFESFIETSYSVQSKMLKRRES